MNKSSTKKQHYVPQFYLRQWVDDEGGFYPIEVTDDKPPTLKIFDRKSDPSRFCYENYFYAQKTGVADDTSQILEEMFAKIEAASADYLPDIKEKILTNKQLEFSDKYLLSQIGLTLHFRGKEWRKQSEDMHDQMIKSINNTLVRGIDKNPQTAEDMRRLGITKEEMIEFAESGEYTVEFGNGRHLAIMENLEGFTNLLSGKYWKIYVSREGGFIATDTPFLDIAMETKSFWGNDYLSRKQIFVVSPEIAIETLYPHSFTGKKMKRVDVTGNWAMIHWINYGCIMSAQKFGFHKDKNILHGVKNYAALRREMLRNENDVEEVS